MGRASNESILSNVTSHSPFKEE